MKALLISLFAGIALTASSLADELSGTVTKVVDGDTADVTQDSGKTERIRFHGIDAPESHQDFGQVAKRHLSGLVAGKRVRVEYKPSRDRHGRIIGKVYQGGTYVNLEMAKAGYAWHYAQYAPDDRDIAEAEKTARAAKRGLWADPHAIPPWEYRHGGKPKRPDTAQAAAQGLYWISGTGKTHNSSCEHYGSSAKGHFSKEPSGNDCKMCGGARR